MDIKKIRFSSSTLLLVAALSSNAFAESQAPEYYRDNPLPPPPPAPTSQTMQQDSQGMMPMSPQNQELRQDADPGINDAVTPPNPGPIPATDRGTVPPPPPPPKMQRNYKPGRAPRNQPSSQSMPSVSSPIAAPVPTTSPATAPTAPVTTDSSSNGM